MYVRRMYVCMYVGMYGCMEWMDADGMYASMALCMHAWID